MNRPYVDVKGISKPIGLVVDFVGVLRELRKALQSDASLSLRHAGWGVQNGTTGPISGDFQRPFHSQISYATGLTCRLTCQVEKWEPVLK